MARIVPLHSKSVVRRAGEVISKGGSTRADVDVAREVLSNYRSAHGYPLNAVTIHVRQRAIAVSPDAIVARRLKRLPTILDKLERFPRMNVTTMQDLGGCRVILETVQQVHELVDGLKGSTRAQNRIVRDYNYIDGDPGPKRSGYRGIHLVYEYHASQREFDGLRIEMQARTNLQHAWATAVETIDLFSGSELKYDKAEEDIRRYFAIVSSLMAISEGAPQVPEAEEHADVLRRELRSLEKKNGVMTRLQGYAAIVGQHAHSDRRSVLTLELKRQQQELRVVVHETLAEAEGRLAALESLDDENLDAVLVGINKIGQLQSAYPNYYANTTTFTDFAREQLK